MFEKICCIFDSDEQYAIRLMEAMNDSVDLPYKVLAYTSKTALMECSQKYEIEILLSSEEKDEKVIETIRPNYFFMLSEQKSNPAENTICKYQSVEGIIKELLAGLTDGGVVINNNSIKTTVVYSPTNLSMKTTLALGYTLYMSKSERVLYINLDEFATLGEMFEKSELDLSDALFFYVSDSDNRMSKILSCINNKYGFDYFYPVSCPEDIGCINADLISGFITEIANSGIYKEIVIDMGNLVSNPWEIMIRCDQILMPQPVDELSIEKMNLFFDYINNSKYRNIAKMVKKVKIGYNRELAGKCVTMTHINSFDVEGGIREFMYG